MSPFPARSNPELVTDRGAASTESLVQNKKLTLTTSADKSLPIGLADEQRLTQVLLNLVHNAIKFTDAGQVSIATGVRNGHFSWTATDVDGDKLTIALFRWESKAHSADLRHRALCHHSEGIFLKYMGRQSRTATGSGCLNARLQPLMQVAKVARPGQIGYYRGRRLSSQPARAP